MFEDKELDKIVEERAKQKAIAPVSVEVHS